MKYIFLNFVMFLCFIDETGMIMYRYFFFTLFSLIEIFYKQISSILHHLILCELIFWKFFSMQQLYGDFMKIKEKESIKMKNSLFNQIVNSYNFETNYIKINQIKNKIKIITIDIVSVLNNNYLIFCFNQNLFVINLTEFNLIKHYFANNKDSDIFILNANTPNSFLENFDQYSKIHIEQIGSYFQTEINDFCNDFNTIEKIKFWNLIKRCFSGYL